MVNPKAPLQGQLLKLDLDPTLGHEQKGCPALVVSATLFISHTGFCWAAPITTPKKGWPNEIRLPEGLPVHGALLLSQLLSIDWRARPFTATGIVPAPFVEDVNARLSSVLDTA
jgi:mRNA interferase MazF